MSSPKRSSGRSPRSLAAAAALAALAALGLVAPAPAGALSRSQGARVAAVAHRYVGHARYVEGGSSPRGGFDCSGYTMYVYRAARVARLPHDAEAQRQLRRMHSVGRKHVHKGDLIFYLDGGRAYHVAIYAGHGMQYSAATPRDGVRYQRIWSRSVQYKRYR